VSLGLTTVWEEWSVSGWARRREDHPPFYGRVLRANLMILLVLLGVSAAVAVPRRLAAPDVLLKW
jgi:hypothetical protein